MLTIMPKRLESLVFVVALATPGCGGDSCKCLPSGIYISTHGAQAKSMTLTGPACETAKVSSSVEVSRDAGPMYVNRSDVFVPNAFDYSIQPAAAGDCTVHIELESGSVDKTVTFRYSSGDCCKGYYTSDSMWNLHALELALDAGTS